MKNFGTLYGYELKKLLKRKLSWVLVLFLAAFCAYVIFKAGASFAGISFPAFDENGSETGEYHIFSGEELYDIWLSAKKLNGRVLDDALFQEMLESVPDLEGLPREWYFLTEDYTWCRLYDMVGLADPRSVTAEKFYAAQWEKTQWYWKESGLSEGEKAYWTEKAAQIPKPWVYQEPWAGANRTFDMINILFLCLPLAAAVCVCTLFSEDRRTRAEPLVLTTRESRAALFWAKLLAGVTMTALAAAILVGTVVGSLLCVWGTEGLDAPIQFYSSSSPRPITMAQMFLPIVLLLVLFTLLYGGMAMLVSIITHSSLAALGGPVVLSFVMYLCTALAPLQNGGLTDYLRTNLMGLVGVRNLHLVNLFGVYLDNFQFGTILYLCVAVLLLALCLPFWRRCAAGRA